MVGDIILMFFDTILDLAPIILLILFFQIFVLKKNIPNFRRVLMGMTFVTIGLTFFLLGLEKALFPIGKIMAEQLSNPEFIRVSTNEPPTWASYYWIYTFSSLIGFSTTIAEPSLKAVAMKANEVSGGSISEIGLRLVVAVGAGIALTLGAYRIVMGTPLFHYLIVCYVIVIILTIFSPKDIVALAYDSGGVTTSTVTVPVVAAIGIGLSTVVPGRNPAMDGFGLIALVCMFPIITVLSYSIITTRLFSFLKKMRRHEI